MFYYENNDFDTILMSGLNYLINNWQKVIMVVLAYYLAKKILKKFIFLAIIAGACYLLFNGNIEALTSLN